MKLKLAALALAATTLAGSAFAATLADGTTGNGSLILNVYDATTKVSYVKDTGLRLNDFTGTSNLSFDLSGDANWTTFLANTAAGDYVRYNVVAWSDVNSPLNFKALTTTNAPATQGSTTSGNVGFTTNNQLKQATAGENPFINALSNGPVNDPLNPNPAHDSAFVTQASFSPGYFGDSFQDTWNTKFSFDTTADIGTSLNVYKLSLNGTANLSKVLITSYSGQWDLSKAGALTYTVPGTPPTVPEPSSLVLALAGFSVVGAIVRRRAAR